MGGKKRRSEITPSTSSMMSRPTVAKVVHLQLAIAFAAHRLCTLHLHTSHDKPCDVTVVDANNYVREEDERKTEKAKIENNHNRILIESRK